MFWHLLSLELRIHILVPQKVVCVINDADSAPIYTERHCCPVIKLLLILSVYLSVQVMWSSGNISPSKRCIKVVRPSYH